MKKRLKNISSTYKTVSKNQDISSIHNNRWIYIILVAIICIVYGNSLTNGYGYNDDLNVLSNPHLKNIKLIFSFDSGISLYDTINFPLSRFVFLLENMIFGFNPFVSHLINLFFFAGAVLLVYKTMVNHFFNNNNWQPLVISVLFLLHPIHTEVVNNIQNRGDILAFLFSVLSMDLLLTYLNNQRLKYLLFFILTYICAILCTPFSIVIIITIIGYILLLKTDKMRSKEFILIVFLFLFSVFYLFLIYQKMRPVIFFVQNPIVTYSSFIDKFSLIAVAAITYFKLLLFPLRLSFYYGYNTVPVNKFIVLFSIMFHILLVSGFFYFLKKKKFISFLIFFYFSGLLFYCSLIFPYPGIISERAMLFASLPFCILLVSVTDTLFKVELDSLLKRPAFGYAFLIISCLLAVRTIARNMDWKDPLTLMTNDAKHLENSANANYILAEQYILAYNIDENTDWKITAETALKTSLTVLPDYSLALSKLGYLYSVINNDTVEGLKYMQKAYDADPNDATIVSNLALGYNKTANPDSALSLFKKAIQIDSNNRWSYFYAAQLLFDKGKQREAFEQNEQLRIKFAENELAYLNYGTFYFRLGNEDSSVANFELAVKYGSKNKGLINHLYSVFSKKGDVKKASYYQSLMNDAD